MNESIPHGKERLKKGEWIMRQFQGGYPDDYDVVVAGGGPAGIAAAVSAARFGARTALVERYGILGGMLTSGHVQPILGSVQEYTFYHEVVELLEAGHEVRPVRTRNGREVAVDVEEAKHRLLKLCLESGVYVYLQTPVVDAVMEGKRVCGVRIGTPAGIRALTGRAVVDATGDGFVAAMAGVPFAAGRESDGKCQPASLEFTVENVDQASRFACYGGSDPVLLPDGRRYSLVCREACERGELPPNVSIVRIHATLQPGERNINATQVNGRDTLSVEGSVEAEYLLREQIPAVVGFLRKYAPGFENCRVKSSASTLGVRESRRFAGDYVLSDRDVEQGARFEDVVVHRAWFLIDIHNPSGGGQAEGHSQPAQPYDIPYRSLLPRGAEGLLLSGRNISGTHRAHASYRVMGIAMPVGQAAGTAAALCARHGCTPRELDFHIVQQALAAAGCRLFDGRDG